MFKPIFPDKYDWHGWEVVQFDYGVRREAVEKILPFATAKGYMGPL